MSASSQESIKHITKSELKTELTKRGLPLNGRKDDLLKIQKKFKAIMKGKKSSIKKQ